MLLLNTCESTVAMAETPEDGMLLGENRQVTTSVTPSRKTLAVIVGAGALFVSAAAFNLASRSTSAGSLTASMEAGANKEGERLAADTVFFPVPKSDGSGDMTSITATNEMLSVHGQAGTDYPWMDGLLIEVNVMKQAGWKDVGRRRGIFHWSQISHEPQPLTIPAVVLSASLIFQRRSLRGARKATGAWCIKTRRTRSRAQSPLTRSCTCSRRSANTTSSEHHIQLTAPSWWMRPRR